jgi:SNF2 family DNA or RNA helicase
VCNHPDLLGTASDEDENEATESKKGKRSKTNVSDLLAKPSAFLARSGKLQRLTEMLEELLSEGDRTLIFTQFATWGTWMQNYLQQQFGREVLFLYGSTSQKQREEMVDRFQNDPQGPRIFILSLKAGGVGLNLTRANHVFHFDRWWNPAVENQATDRAFRIGQTRNVQVHKFVCTGTLEERINELIEGKKALAENIVGTGENWLTELDTEALRDLLLLDRAAVIDDAP